MSKLRIFIADDQELYIAGLVPMLQSELECSIVGVAHSADELMLRLPALQVDILILELEIFGGPRLDQIRRVHHCLPDSKILVVSRSSRPEGLLTIAGVHAYLTKRAGVREIAHALKALTVDSQESTSRGKLSAMLL